MTPQAPRGLHRLAHLWRSLARRHALEQELDEELRFHFDQLVERSRARGLSERQARLEAERAFGSLHRARTESREAWGRRVLDDLGRDVQYAFRSLRRTPGFSVVVVLVLALGIGATTTIFGVFDAVLLRPLPYPESDRLVTAVVRYESGTRDALDRAGYETVRDGASLLEQVAAESPANGVNLQWPEGARHLREVAVTASYLDALGAEAWLGRLFERADEDPGAPRRLVVSHRVFERDLGGDRARLDSLLRLGGEPHELIGVLPAWFVPAHPVDLWTALRSDDHRGGGTNLRVIARLRPGVSSAQAAGELDTLSERYRERSPDAIRDGRLSTVSLQDQIGGSLRPTLLMLLAAVGLLLLVACVNTAALLTARATARERELAVRRTLGGSRLRLIRQLLTESLVLGLAGGALGVGLAALALRSGPLLALLSPGAAVDATVWAPRLDARVLLAALATSLVAAIGFGVAPALRSVAVRRGGRETLASALRAGAGRQSSGAPALLLHRLLVVLEVALCVLLLVGAGLLLRSLLSLRAVDPGVDPAGVVTAQMSLAGDPDPMARVERYRALLGELEASPLIEAAALTNGLPVERGLNLPIHVPGAEDTGEVTAVDWRYVTPGFFVALRVPVVRGRPITEADGAGGSVVVVNEAFVRRFLEEGEPLGRTLELYGLGPDAEDRPREVIGVVADVKGNGLEGPAIPTLYVPLSQVPSGLLAVTHQYFPMSWIVRSRAGADAGRLLTERVRALDPEVPFAAVRPMTEVIAASYGDRRLHATLLGTFAALALAMAVTGVYGLIAYTVSVRTREIGIRTALGARWSETVAGVVRQALLLAAGGAALGLVGALLLRRLLQGFLYGVEPSDPRTLAGAAAAMLVAATVAALAPAVRAARIDPAKVLRQD
ncbi:MAG TPA: ADOP family duplicated permease [Thermoanaerobaculia bacterium]|nr:ADOP family duplicated permease [Thermoanaerobaculia bacterium]